MINYGGNGPSSSSMINNGNGKIQYGSEKIVNTSAVGKGGKKVQKKRRQMNVSGGAGSGGGNMLNSNSAGNMYATEQSYRHGNMNNDGINLPRIN
eukprot:gene29941-39114_t